MPFRIRGLPRSDFLHLIGQPDEVLRRSGAERVRVDAAPGYPDRITLDDAPAGETVLLLNHAHQPADSPFRAHGAIFVREQGGATFDGVDVIPPALARRLVALRAYDARDRIIEAEIAPGDALPSLIARLLARGETRYLHAHYAKWGCYAARIDRA